MNTTIIKLLNHSLSDELGAVHQYMYFHFHCHDQGLHGLSDLFRQTAIAEMTHVERLAERIIFLKGDAEMQVDNSTEKIKDVKEMLTRAMSMEEQSVRDYNKWASECAANEDAVSRQLFEALLAEEEKHYDRFARELDNIVKFGDQYLALQSMDGGKCSVEKSIVK